MSVPRLLWVTQNYHPNRGGMAQSCDRIVHGLRDAGVTVDVAHFSHRAQRNPVRQEHRGRYLACPVGDDASHAMNLLWNTVSAENAGSPCTHVVAFGGALPLVAAPVYAAWLERPLTVLLRGNDFDSAVFNPKRRDILADALSRANRVCVVSREMQDKVAGLFPGCRPVWVPNGIDLKDWRPLPSDRRRARAWRDGEVPAGRRVLGLFGHIKQKKGGLFFLESLLDSGRQARFHLLFVGEVEAPINQWLEAHREQVSHTTLPFLERYDLLPYYLACDLVVIASYYDGMPNVMLEAAALGIPLLASTAGGMGDLLEHGTHGYLFPPGDRHGCRAALERATTADATELSDLGGNCTNLIRKRLTHHQETRRYLELFNLEATLDPFVQVVTQCYV